MDFTSRRIDVFCMIRRETVSPRLFAERPELLHEVNSNGSNTLNYAAALGKERIALYLLQQGVDPCLRNREGRDAAYHAERMGLATLLHRIRGTKPACARRLLF